MIRRQPPQATPIICSAPATTMTPLPEVIDRFWDQQAVPPTTYQLAAMPFRVRGIGQVHGSRRSLPNGFTPKVDVAILLEAREGSRRGVHGPICRPSPSMFGEVGVTGDERCRRRQRAQA